mmetsp:Transcript_1825/g.6508  ORF Transcript_1825/g.6508 Transcript_1825/m.6508 type:complete len:251 (-) Transcript_1825:141-893(-)
MSASWLVTGANRGIGLHIVKRLSELSQPVIATCRNVETATQLREVDGVRVEQLDVSSVDSCNALFSRLSADSVKLKAIINNAGVFDKVFTTVEKDSDGNEKTVQHDSYSTGFFNLTPDVFQKHFLVNTVGPFSVTKALHTLLEKGGDKPPVVAHISSIMGSIDCTRGTSNAGQYRVSKSALNMINMLMVGEMPDTTCVVLHPGWVKTDMGGDSAAVEVEDSANGLVNVLQGLTLEQTGKFYDYQGKELPW